MRAFIYAYTGSVTNSHTLFFALSHPLIVYVAWKTALLSGLGKLVLLISLKMQIIKTNSVIRNETLKSMVKNKAIIVEYFLDSKNSQMCLYYKWLGRSFDYPIFGIPYLFSPVCGKPLIRFAVYC